MATEDLKAKLKPGSFRGAFLFVTGITQSGGKAHAKKKIPDSDLQKVEDLGNNDPTYVVSGFISPRYQVSTNDGDPESISENPTYALMRDTLIAAFKMPGYGIQVNPFGPDIDFAMCIEWSIGEAQTTLGLTPVSYTLEISSLDALLTEDSSTQAQVDAAAGASMDEANGEMAGGFLVSVADNYNSAKEKVQGGIDAAKGAVEGLEKGLAALDRFYTDLNNMTADIAELMATPQKLADSYTNAMNTMGSMITTVKGSFQSMTNMFDFGSHDAPSEVVTFVSIERDRNNAAISDGITKMALALGYQYATQIDFDTVEDIDAVNELLEEQFRLRAQTEAMIALRAAAQALFDLKRANARRIITVKTFPTSCRLLAYENYGSSELGEQIANLNGIHHSDEVSGDIEIFTA